LLPSGPEVGLRMAQNSTVVEPGLPHRLYRLWPIV